MRPSHARRRDRLIACGALLAARALAQNTIVANPEFDAGVGISDWFVAKSLQISSWSLDDADDCAGSGSYSALALEQSESASLAIAVPNDCLDVQPDAQLFLQVTYRSAMPLYLYLFLYPSAGCQGARFTEDVLTAHPASAVWTTVESVTTLPVGDPVASVRFVAVSQDDLGSSFSTSFDRPYLGLSERIFGDDFDAGSTCRWSATSPPP